MVVLKELKSDDDWQKWESEYIAKYKQEWNLTNIASGGEGGALYTAKGENHSQYGRGKRGFKPWNIGLKHSEETINKIKNNPRVPHIGESNGNWKNGKKIAGIKNVNATPIMVSCINSNDILYIFPTREATCKGLNICGSTVDLAIKKGYRKDKKFTKISKEEYEKFKK